MDPNDTQTRIDKLFVPLAGSLKDCLPNARIEQIGSTSSVGASSKDGLVVLITVPRGEHEASLTTLQELGFQVAPDSHRSQTRSIMTAQIFNMEVSVQLVEAGQV